MARSVAYLDCYNITAVTSGPALLVEAWRGAATAHIIPDIMFNASDLPPVERPLALCKAGQLAMLGEITCEYDDPSPEDPKLDPYFILAEERDVPVAITWVPDRPARPVPAGLTGSRLSDFLLRENVLIHHPRLRIYAMRAGWAIADRVIGLLYARA